MEVAESEADSFDAFDQVVDGFGGPVGDFSEVVVAYLVEPSVQGAP